MFYTNVTKIGNKLFHRYVENGKRFIEIVDSFTYDLYLKSEYSNDSVDVFGNTLKKYVFDDIYSMSNFIKDNGHSSVYGNTDPVSQFITKTYPNTIKLTNEYKVLNFDIETEHATGIPRYSQLDVVQYKIENNDGTIFDEAKTLLQDIKLISLNVDQTLYVFDIEKNKYVLFQDSCFAPKNLGFPNPYLAKCEILSISLIETDSDYIVVYGTKPYNGGEMIEGSKYKIKYVECINERDLLLKFIAKWRQLKPDILTGWNIERFDIPYVINRITKVLGKKAANLLSPYSDYSDNCISESQKESDVYYSIKGITIFDYISLYIKFSREKQESYKLDWIGEVELKHTKTSYAEYDNSLMKLWEMNFDLFVLYNANDSLIVTRLDEKLKFINLAITIAHITKSNLDDAMGTIKIWDNIIYNLLSKKNIQIIPKIKKEKTKEFLGAFVKFPLIGAHGWVITFDLTSLYPSIIRMLGMSPETLFYREIGREIGANKKIINRLMEDLDNINYQIKISDKTNKPYVYDLYDQQNKKEKEIEYYQSGHDYIHGVHTVLENISNFIDMKTDLSFANDLNVTVAGNGSLYKKSVNGVIPEAMEMLFYYRKSLKSEMKEKKKLLQEKIKKLHELEAQL